MFFPRTKNEMALYKAMREGKKIYIKGCNLIEGTSYQEIDWCLEKEGNEIQNDPIKLQEMDTHNQKSIPKWVDINKEDPYYEKRKTDDR